MANKVFIIWLAITICSSALAEGQKQNPETEPNSLFMIGPGVFVNVVPYKGMDPDIYPIPVVAAVKAPFYFFVDTAGCRVFSDANMTFDFIARLRLDGYEADESSFFKGMHNRHMSVDAGGEFGISGNWGELYTTALTDALNQHKGQELRETYSKPFKFEKSEIAPCAGVSLLSSNLANYYYGVRSDEAGPGRPANEPGDSVNWFVGMDAHYKCNDKWTLLTRITYYFLDSDISNSPIVSKDYEITILLGAIYRF